jgi:hypothetical protein
MKVTQKILPKAEYTKLPCAGAAFSKVDDRAPQRCAFFVFSPAGAGR